MFKWIKRFFGEMDHAEFKALPRVCDIPMPEVKPPKPEKDISEPVFAIVECMKKYPSRWKLKDDRFKGLGRIYTVMDIKTGLVIVQYVSYHAGYGEYHKTTIDNIKLTNDEEDLLRQSLITLSNMKEFRFKSMKELGSKRRDIIERKRLMEIYK